MRLVLETSILDKKKMLQMTLLTYDFIANNSDMNTNKMIVNKNKWRSVFSEWVV